MKVFLYENEKGLRIRYAFDNDIWFNAKDISKILDNKVDLSSIDDEDKRDISFTGKLGMPETSTFVNTFGVGHLVMLSKMFKVTSGGMLKESIKNGIVPAVNRLKSLSREDEIALKIVHSNSETERAKLISEYKNTIIQSNKPEVKVTIPTPVSSTSNVHTLRDVNAALGLRKGAITKWASEKGLFFYGGKSNKSPKITEEGREYFKTFKQGTSINKIGLTDKGFALVESNIEEINTY